MMHDCEGDEEIELSKSDCEGEQEVELSIGAFQELKNALLATGLQCHVAGDDLLLFQDLLVRPRGINYAAGIYSLPPCAEESEGIVA